MWVLGAIHDFLTPLKFSLSELYGQLKEFLVFQHREKGGKHCSETKSKY